MSKCPKHKTLHDLHAFKGKGTAYKSKREAKYTQWQGRTSNVLTIQLSKGWQYEPKWKKKKKKKGGEYSRVAKKLCWN